jgi:hypothetical protein
MKSWKNEKKKKKKLNDQRFELDLQTSIYLEPPLNLTKLTFIVKPCRFKKLKNLGDGG